MKFVQPKIRVLMAARIRGVALVLLVVLVAVIGFRKQQKIQRQLIVKYTDSLRKQLRFPAQLHHQENFGSLGPSATSESADSPTKDVPATPVGQQFSNLLMRYTACGGLVNQVYSHIHALALAEMLHADAVVLPAALARSSFKAKYALERENDEVRWHPLPLDALLDVQTTTAVWKQRGVHLCLAPLPPQPTPSQPILLSDGGTFFPNYSLPELAPGQTVQLEGIWLKTLPAQELLARATARIAQAAAAAGSRGLPMGPPPGGATAVLPAALQAATVAAGVGQPGGGSSNHVVGQDANGGGGCGISPGTVVLDLPCAFFSLNATTALPTVLRVAQGLEFSPAVRAVAERVLDHISQGGRLRFNAFHFRMERDATEMQKMYGSFERFLQLHMEAMQQLGFDPSTPLYIATGLLSYPEGRPLWEEAARKLLAANLTSRILHKGDIIPQDQLQGLETEQQALVDFLVMARSWRLVGIAFSTFGLYLREYRAFKLGIPHATAALVDEALVMSDPTFRAGYQIVEQRL